MHTITCKACLAGAIILFLAGCGDRREIGENSRTNIESMSPSDVVRLYFKASKAGDKSTLRKIILFPPNTTQAEIDKKIQAVIRESKAVGGILGNQFVKRDVEYEKIRSADSAEVGLIMTSMGKRIPVMQIMLRKDGGIWKYDRSTYALSESELLDRIKKDPKDASAYYLLARKIQPENPARAVKYLKKYHELEPTGFWAANESSTECAVDLDKKEEELLGLLDGLAENSGNRQTVYTKLGLLCIEKKDFEAAEKYLNEAEKSNKIDPSAIGMRRLASARKRLERCIQKERAKLDKKADADRK